MRTYEKVLLLVSLLTALGKMFSTFKNNLVFTFTHVTGLLSGSESQGLQFKH